jgi:hypothetical protein
MARRGTAGTPESQEATATTPQVLSMTNSTAPRGNGNAGQANPAGSHSAQTFSSDEIAQRAYEIYEREGRADGRDMDHWLQAERELREERSRTRAAVSQAQADSRAPEPNRGGTASRPQRPEEAPRSARRHQPSMA